MTGGTIPCIRHGAAAGQDARVERALQAAVTRNHAIAANLLSLVDFEDTLWVTWADAVARDASRAIVDAAWASATGSSLTRHLVPIDEDYDYQDECMGNAD